MALSLRSASGVILMILSGCVSAQDRSEVKRYEKQADEKRAAAIDSTLPTCATDAECAALMDKAKAWIAAHPNKRRMVIKGDRVSVMFRGNTVLFMDVTLKPLADKRYLDTRITCQRVGLLVTACGDEPEFLRLEFNKAMTASE